MRTRYSQRAVIFMLTYNSECYNKCYELNLNAKEALSISYQSVLSVIYVDFQ